MARTADRPIRVDSASPGNAAMPPAAGNRSLISLSPEAAVAFTEALERPATVNERLAEALERTKPPSSWDY